MLEKLGEIQCSDDLSLTEGLSDLTGMSGKKNDCKSRGLPLLPQALTKNFKITAFETFYGSLALRT